MDCSFLLGHMWLSYLQIKEVSENKHQKVFPELFLLKRELAVLLSSSREVSHHLHDKKKKKGKKKNWH